MTSPSLTTLFSERLFTIPDYQRGYAWEDPHRKALFDDIEAVPDDKAHFMGLVVFHNAGDVVQDFQHRDLQPVHVVDGQQRLTSIILLTDALARAYQQLGADEEASSLRSHFVVGMTRHGMPVWRFKPASHDLAWWTGAVLGSEVPVQTPGDAAQRRMWRARTQFDELIEERRSTLDATDFRTWLDQFSSRVRHQLRFALYEVDDQADVGVIFEVMNDRGKPLTAMEMVKNHLLLVARRLRVPTDDLVGLILQSWRQMHQQLDAAGLYHSDDDVLRTHWLVTISPDSRSWKGYASIKQHIAALRARHDDPGLVAALDNYVRTLSNCGFAFIAVANPAQHAAFAGWGRLEHDARHWGKKVLRIGRQAALRPFLVAVRMTCGTDHAAYVAALQAAERYAFRVYAAVGWRSHTGRSKLFKLAHNVFTRRDGIGAADAATKLDAITAYYCDDETFEEMMGQTRNWYEKWSHSLRYFFYEYEEHLARQGGIQLHWEDITGRDLADTIEHIYPQTPNDPSWKEAFPTKADRDLKHDLGNLVLTARAANSRYGNKAFVDKRGRLGQETACFANGIYQEQELAKHTRWTPNLVRRRHASLAAWAAQRWALPAGIVADETDEVEDDFGEE